MVKYRNIPRSEQQVNMIGPNGPSRARGLCLGENSPQPIQEISVVIWVFEDGLAFNTANNYVMQGFTRIYASFPWHALPVAEILKNVNISPSSPIS